MEQRLSLITLGVSDLSRSTQFYEQLGWRRSVQQAEGVAFFQVGCFVLSLFPLHDLAKDAGVTLERSGFASACLAYNTRTRAEVDAVLAEAQEAGATLIKQAQETFWGGYSGYFADLDGYLWEVAWNPSFPIAEDGSIHLPD